MRYAKLLGWAWLGVSLVACGAVNRDVQLTDEHPVGASSGEGGGAEINTGEWATLPASEPATVVSGTLEFAQDGVLTVGVPGKGPLKLRMDESTRAVQARRAISPESLLEGTEVRVSYVMEDGLPTARMVRAEPQRYTR